MTRKLDGYIIRIRQENLAILFGGFSMNKEEILEKSRAENRIGIKIFMRKRF